MGTLEVDLLVAAVALVAGHLAGSIRVDRLVLRGAGIPVPEGWRDTPGHVTGLAGPGWGLLALTGDLAKGVLPVAIGSVTWSWGTGWAAAVGAVLGACWPMLGRWTGGSGLVVLGGALFALEPPAAAIATLCAAVALGVARLLGRDGRRAGVATGLVVYPLVFAAAEADVRRLLAVLALYAIAAVRFATKRP